MQWPDGRTCTLPGHTARPAARLTVLVLALLWLCLVGSMAEGSVARTAKKRSTSADGSANSADYNVDRIQRSLSLHAGIERTFWIAHKIGVTLEITANGTVRGTTHPNPPYGVLLSKPLSDGVNGSVSLGRDVTPSPKFLALKANKTQLYLCMNKSGHAYSMFLAPDKTISDECKWEEKLLENYYTTYCRKKIPSKRRGRGRVMCLGFDNSNRLMNGLRVNATRNEAMFQNRPANKTAINSLTSPFKFSSSTTPPAHQPTTSKGNRGHKRRHRKKNRKRRKRLGRRKDRGGKGCLFCLEIPNRSERRRRRNRRKHKRHQQRTRTTSASRVLFSTANH